MNDTKVNPQDVIFALDIGTRSVIGTAGTVRDKKFHVVAEYCMEHEERAMIDGQIHDIGLVANAVNNVKKQLEEKLNMKMEKVSIAAAGRFLRTVVAKAQLKIDYDKEIDKDTVRSLELTAVKSAEEKINEQREGKLYCVGYSVKNYYLNGYIINNLLSHKGENIEAEVIATFLPRSVVDSLYSVMEKVGLEVASMTLEPIAAMEAAIPQNLRLLNLALIDVGAGTSDIAISSKDTISAYGMVPLAGDEVTETIAQNYLVDFNTAEYIKRHCTNEEKLVYKDVLGLENEINCEDVIKFISPTVKKIADEIGSKIIELNGDKSPNAIFIVGGGAYTPNLKEFLADKLNILPQRIAVKGREAVTECVCQDNSLGSTGVTVLGIALISIKRLGHDFIDVILNDKVISLFNSHKHTVMDVMMQGGINPKVLIGRNGKNIRFTLNGIKRVAFGTLASSAEIVINGVKSSIDEEVKEGDNIEIKYAREGSDAAPCALDYVKKLYSISFFINDIIENLEPIAIINGKKADINEKIKEDDEVEIVFPENLGQYKKYLVENSEEYKYYLNGTEISDAYEIKEGDRIYSIKYDEVEKQKIVEETEKQKDIEDMEKTKAEEEVDKPKDVEQTADENEINTVEENTETEVNKEEIISENKKTEEKSDISQENNEIKSEDLHKEEKTEDKLEVVVNGKNIYLKGKKEYVFIDIFNYIDFDLTIPKGKIYLRLNQKDAGYYDNLSGGDIIEVGWE
ncbi:cell division protein FtsA [Clostridium sp. P21]|uniref:Cell division protein FtsA n=1 Tax=Clostridium muellerianum TaxID=2716538 RepID=A0A7Y0EGP1_9CLOT|nr:cell division FtsA domain-containing protein [Clostridium muellerianum]NMM63161.1 cell division protein FtsA [Clostridium muellerianum]